MPCVSTKHNKTPEEALAQIDAKDYALPFFADGRQLVKVGVNFSEKEQTIDGWVVGFVAKVVIVKHLFEGIVFQDDKRSGKGAIEYDYCPRK